MIPLNLLTHYQKQPPSEGSLQHLALRQFFSPPCLADYLIDPNQTTPPEIRKLYPSIMPQKLRVEQLKKKYLDELKQAFAICFECYEMKERLAVTFYPQLRQKILDELESLEAKDRLNWERLKPLGSFVEEILTEFYDEGVCLLSKYLQHFYAIGQKSCKDNPEIEQFAKKWFEKVHRDFQGGDCRSFDAIAKWQTDRSISYNIRFNPFRDSKPNLELLKKLAYLGVKAALEKISEIQESDALGANRHKAKKRAAVAISEKKLSDLLELQELGSEQARRDLIFEIQFNHDLSRQQKKEIADELIRNEVGLTEQITDLYVSNIDRLFGQGIFSHDEVLQAVSERARRGEVAACKEIWSYYYIQNSFKPRQELTEEQRQKAIQDLMTPENVKAMSQAQQYWILRDPKDCKHPCAWPVLDKLRFLESIESPYLQEIYKKNKLQGEPLNLNFEERLEKIKDQAQNGSSYAMRVLIGYYIHPGLETFSDEASLNGQRRAPREIFGSIDALKILVAIALEGGGEPMITLLDNWKQGQDKQNLQTINKLLKTIV